uniref:Uncharacterized protein n=1 Tax=Panagrolaimus sp. ES5 TaxID=591445 RepID=A0AC34G8D2_9BILA
MESNRKEARLGVILDTLRQFFEFDLIVSEKIEDENIEDYRLEAERIKAEINEAEIEEIDQFVDKHEALRVEADNI